MTTFQKDFDTLLNNLLTDYQNQFPEADISQGSLIFIKSACTASALWGLYKYQEWISRQMFPDTAETEALEHHAWIRGIERTYGETDAAYLARLLEYIRRPPAGGNQYDYVKWAKEVDNVKAAYCFPTRSLGSLSVIVLANEDNTGSEAPTQGLLDAVKAYIVDLAPVTASVIRVFGPTIITQNITLAVTGCSSAGKAQIAEDIEAYMKTLEPGDPLALSQLMTIAITNGAEDAVVTLPAANVTVSFFQMLRPGVISVA